MATENINKIVKYKKKKQFNYIAVVFALILVYLGAQIIRWNDQETIRMFTVQNAEASTPLHEYRGIITREEIIYQTPESGLVNYHVREGQKVGIGSTVYSSDESGEFSKMLAETYTDGTCLSDKSLLELKTMFTSLDTEPDSSDFYNAYSEKSEISASVTDTFLYTAMSQLFTEQNVSTLDRVTSDRSGYILFQTDGLEGLTARDVEKDTFKESNVKKTVYISGEERTAGSFAYKLIPDDTFTITFMITDEDLQRYQDKKYINIELISLGVTVNGSFSTFSGADGTQLACVTISKYGSHYLTSRFLDFKITDSSVTGYKIPVTSVTSKNFFVVPREFIGKGGATGNTYGVYREVSSYADEQGEFVAVSIYAETDAYYYISASSLKTGDYLIQDGTSNRYLLSITAPLQGVYNINRGYCIFRQVEILALTADKNYYIVDTGTRFGLSPYDRIVLNADLVTENQIIN